MEVEMEAEDRMQKTLASVVNDLMTLRAGRATPAMLDRVEVDYYGAPTPLKSLAGVSTPDASTLVISPYDKGALEGIERALQTSDLGLTPNNDGERIRLNIPQLTEERRKEMVKVVSKMGEEGKVALRNIRRDAIKSMEKLDLPEDDERYLEDEVQKLTDKYVKKVGDAVKDKEKELTTL
ncbi:unnamed protein product [Ostreobium quekettii]|uniref:Ribosome-recycling factor, chloroplastic n=1 Tax=Ostreobium quekettii TaxID=121088 RepID=A0A8S1JAD0_9CHLO|nr:unnamed protein product [Ostreobium quekettii]|eukprot:evm.model.scf_1440.5 EVM.evm.TU.scf_1440.5   scf_1440:12159-13627(-)